MIRTTCLMMALATVAAAQEAEASPLARRLAIEVLRQAAVRQPARAALLDQLVLGLENRVLRLGEVEQVLRIAELTGPLGVAPVVGTGPALATQPEPVTRPEEVMAVLDAGTAESTAPIAGPAQAGPAEAVTTDDGADKALPALPSDQRGGPEVGIRINAVHADGDQGARLLMFARGSDAGVARQQRYRVERDGRTLVMAVVFRVHTTSAVAMVLESSWVVPAEEREIRVGDQAVLDR